MKKYYFAIEFILIAFFYLLPPLFASPASAASRAKWTFPYTVCLWFALSVFIYIRSKKESAKPAVKSAKAIVMIGQSLLTFGQLCVTFAIINFACIIAGIQGPAQPLPRSCIEYALCVAAFGLSAFYEEIMYRFYLPRALYHLCRCAHSRARRLLFEEIAPVAVFALAHRYMGGAAIINAFVCGIFLRLCMKKNTSPLPCVTAHFAYNIFMLVMQTAAS